LSWLSCIPWDRRMFRMSVSAKERMANVWRQCQLCSPTFDNFLCGIKVDNSPHLTTPTRHVMVGITRSNVILFFPAESTGFGLVLLSLSFLTAYGEVKHGQRVCVAGPPRRRIETKKSGGFRFDARPQTLCNSFKF